MRVYLLVLVVLFSGGAFGDNNGTYNPVSSNTTYCNSNGQNCMQPPCGLPDPTQFANWGMDLTSALKISESCGVNAHSSGDGSDSNSSSNTSSTKASRQCDKRFKGTSNACYPYSAHTAQQLKKEIDRLKDKINESKANSIKSEQSFQQNMQDLQKQQTNAMTQLVSTIPANQHMEQNTEYINTQKAKADLDTQFTQYQNEYTKAQADYTAALSKIRTDCYTQAVQAYQAQKAAIDKLKQGNGVSVSSARLTTLNNALKTYQSRKMAECLNSTAGAESANQAQVALASQKQQLDNDVTDLNRKRAQYQSQLLLTLDSIQTKYKDQANKAQVEANQASQAMSQANMSHIQEQGNQQNEIADLQKEIDQDTADEKCIEANTGTVAPGDDDDDTTSPQKAIIGAQSIANTCVNKHSDMCNDICSQYVTACKTLHPSGDQKCADAETILNNGTGQSQQQASPPASSGSNSQPAATIQQQRAKPGSTNQSKGSARGG